MNILILIFDLRELKFIIQLFVNYRDKYRIV